MEEPPKESPPKSEVAWIVIAASFILAAPLLWIGLNVLGARTHCASPMKSCQENLTKIDGAKDQYAIDHDLKVGAPVRVEDLVDPIGGTGYLKQFPVEPKGGTYIIGKIGEPPRCSTGLPGHSVSEFGVVITEGD